MKFIMSQVTSDVAAFLRLARKKKKKKEGKKEGKGGKSTLSDPISVSEKLKTTNEVWLRKHGARIKTGETRKNEVKKSKGSSLPP